MNLWSKGCGTAMESASTARLHHLQMQMKMQIYLTPQICWTLLVCVFIVA